MEWAVGRHGGGVIRPRAVLGTLTAGCGKGKARFLALLTGQAPPDPAADLLGDDSDAVYRSTGAALVAAFTRSGVLEQIFPSPIGPAPGMRLLQLRITEQLGHGWDRAQANGQRASYPEGIAEKQFAGTRARLGGGLHGSAAPLGLAQPVAEDAPAIEPIEARVGGCAGGSRAPRR